jgi:hypothetical protein
MKLNELLEVIDFSFDYADDEFDCTFYADAVNNTFSRLVEVERVSHNYVVCKFSQLLREHKYFVYRYIHENAIDSEYAKKLIDGLDNGEEWAFAEIFDGGWMTNMLEEEEKCAMKNLMN